MRTLVIAALNSDIERARPRWFIHGHQHVNRETRLGATQVLGVLEQAWTEFP